MAIEVFVQLLYDSCERGEREREKDERERERAKLVCCMGKN